MLRYLDDVAYRSFFGLAQTSITWVQCGGRHVVADHYKPVLEAALFFGLPESMLDQSAGGLATIDA
ncbi:hypothetical protein D8I24_4413 [Cupriavidus necator H850]|uniref:hypothetical protein n=1 Tax=Cupriavidus necator TaxID=106590 RepID=UPI003FA46129|nr:hypothetical protein D8I24_4413 [Cupriavidus necator H850]